MNYIVLSTDYKPSTRHFVFFDKNDGVIQVSLDFLIDVPLKPIGVFVGIGSQYSRYNLTTPFRSVLHGKERRDKGLVFI